MTELAESKKPEGAVPIRVLFDARGDGAPGSDLGLRVMEADARFAMSDLFEIRLLVQTEDPALTLKTLLRRPTSVYFDAEPFAPRVDGIVRRARVVSIEPAGVSRYELFVVPELWLLGRRRNHRIFKDQTVPAIVDALVSEHAENLVVSPLLSADHASREYTVQYGEDDLHAAFRLLADEGIATYFDFKPNTWVLTDDTTRVSMRLPAAVPFVPPSAMMPDAPHVMEFRPASNAKVSSVAIRDYDYHRPSFRIEAGEGLPDDADLEDYEYEVGEAADVDAAKKRASDTLLSFVGPASEAVCVSSCLIAPGTSFRVSGHPRTEADFDLLVLATTSSWSSPATGGPALVRHELTCMAAANAFKPKRLEKPRIPGVQTAIVVGAPGKEIDVDEEGRVQVEFRWDRRDFGTLGTSRRVRVSQAWAGVGYGLVTVPRVGDEVVIAYLDGDADQPLVVGRVHNPVRPSPLTMPADQTVSVWRTKSSPGGDGYNEILLDDLAGKERFEIHAQRDFTEVVERDATTVIKHDESRTVHGDHTSRTVGKGDLAYQDGFTISTPAKGYISANYLKIDTEARDDHTASAYNHYAGGAFYHVDDVFQIAGPNVNAFAGAKIHLQAGGALLSMTPDTILLEIGGSSIKMTGGVITIVSPLIELNP